MLGILQAFAYRAVEPLTAEQRLLKGVGITEVGDQNTLMNFTPTRPVAEIAKEYVEGFDGVEPANLRRCFQQCLNIVPRKQTMHFAPGKAVRLVAQLIWHQGWRRPEIRCNFGASFG